VSQKIKHLVFTVERYDSTIYAIALWPSVCLSVFWWNWKDATPNQGTKYRWGRWKSAIFNQCLTISQKQCKKETLLLQNANRNSYVLYQMVLFPMTSNDI